MRGGWIGVASRKHSPQQLKIQSACPLVGGSIHRANSTVLTIFVCSAAWTRDQRGRKAVGYRNITSTPFRGRSFGRSIRFGASQKLRRKDWTMLMGSKVTETIYTPG